jgi:hypothetical protein
MKVISLIQTCSACPSQWEGKLEDGRMIYIRYRWGGLAIQISSQPTDDVYDAVAGDYLFKKYYHGGGLDGYITLPEVVDIIEKEHNLTFDCLRPKETEE